MAPVSLEEFPPAEVLKTAIRDAIVNEKCAACPMAVRLGFHQSGTYDKSDNSGGSNGATMRFAPEATLDVNRGLGVMRCLLHDVKLQYPEVSNADIWALASCAAIQMTGGPEIPFAFGRNDAADGSSCPLGERLPKGSGDAAHLREVFGRMGFNDQEIVALSGAHTLGSCHVARSGYEGRWTGRGCGGARFDNQYFKNLMDLEWTTKKWEGPLQYEDPSGRLMMLPTDLALKFDPEFAKFASLYAADERAFFEDFSAAFSKLIHLGCENQPGCPMLPDSAAETFRMAAMHGNLDAVLDAKDVDVNAVEPWSGRSALHKAAFWNHSHVVKYLVEDCKADGNLQDYKGDTALHDAARFGHMESIKLLKGITNLRLKNKAGLDSVALAQEMGHHEAVECLLSKEASRCEVQ